LGTTGGKTGKAIKTFQDLGSANDVWGKVSKDEKPKTIQRKDAG